MMAWWGPLPRSRSGLLVAGALLGVLAFGLVRLAALPFHDAIHYHANWAVWIEGERVDFSHDRYMEDVAACVADPMLTTAEARVHMHENDPDVVHVHHGGATWGHLLQNLGWGVGPDWIVTDGKAMYRAGDGGRLTFILNGLNVPPAHDRVIRPGDRLLISFGTEDAEKLARERFPTVASTALEYDGSFDPGGCAGIEEETFGERLRRAFWY
jgi:hypothetical protein